MGGLCARVLQYAPPRNCAVVHQGSPGGVLCCAVLACVLQDIISNIRLRNTPAMAPDQVRSRHVRTQPARWLQACQLIGWHSNSEWAACQVTP